MGHPLLRRRIGCHVPLHCRGLRPGADEQSASSGARREGVPPMSTARREMPQPTAALQLLALARTDEIVILSESTRQDWPPLSTRPDLDIAITGSMGKASSFGFGLALARPDVRVWVLDTDGALLMNLGSLVTIARAKPANLLHVVYDNDAYDTTGGQPTPG